MSRSTPTASTARAFFALSIALLVFASHSARAEDLYFTDFDEFTAGTDRWAGTNGWISNVSSGGVQGIDNSIIPGLDKTAFIGFNRPPTRFVRVLRPININPVSNHTPVIRFESLMGIENSTNGRGDSFFFSVYNQQGQLLGGLRFNNNPSFPGIWRMDGPTQFDTGTEFITGELQLLLFEIDFEHNTWSADFGGIPLFTNAVFHSLGRTLDLYTIAAEWQVTALDPAFHGDNWMLIADWDVKGIPRGQSSLSISDVHCDTNGIIGLSWLGERGFTYEVEHTHALSSWTSGLPNSVFSGLMGTQALCYVDSFLPQSTSRFYRVRRSITP